MNRSEPLLERRSAVVARAVGAFAGPLTAATARGPVITDVDGGEVLDFAGGIGVLNAGHCPPEVVEAIREQAGRLIHTCIHIATYEPYVALCEKLVELFPHGARTKAMLVNSGAEAVENAIKIARQATGRPAVICFGEAFHGRTLLCTTLTSKTGYKVGCGPFAPEVYRLPFPQEAGSVQEELGRLRHAFATVVSAEHVAAIIIEVVQGEGGFRPVPGEYLRGLREICDAHGIVLVIDEVQTGFCRTGRWAAHHHFDVTPDISTWAKSMGGGLPISAVVGRADVMDAARPGTLGGTYGGNPVACAAALATIGIMERDRLNDRAEAIGARVAARFREVMERCPMVADVRGLGAMQAMELRDAAGGPATGAVRAIVDACRERGLLVIPAGTYSHCIRFLAPLVISDSDLDRGLDILCEETRRVSASSLRLSVS